MSPALEKVRKLLALAGSDNENEARSAALSAARLIKKHGFEVVDQAPPARPPADFFSKRPAPPSEKGTYRNDRPRGGPTAEEIAAFFREMMREQGRGRVPHPPGYPPGDPFADPFAYRPPPRPPFPGEAAAKAAAEQFVRGLTARRILGPDEIRTCRLCSCRVAHGAFWTSHAIKSTDEHGWCERCAP